MEWSVPCLVGTDKGLDVKQTEHEMESKELECDGMVSIQLTQNTNQKLDFVNTIMNHSGVKIVAEFFQ